MVARIKFCGFTREEDVKFADQLGVHAIGFVREPASPRFVSLERVYELVAYAGPFVTRCLVYRHCDEIPEPGFIVQAESFSDRVMQSDIPKVVVLPGHISSKKGLSKINDRVGSVLFDGAKDGYLGGSGQTCDWEFVKEAVDESKLPVILAGGLKPENIREAIEAVHPYAVDVSSGIELAPGIKDHDRMARFVESVQSVLLP